MIFSVQILGSNSALAAHGRHPTAQIVRHHKSIFLIDCGEGTQMRMSTFKIKRSKIKHIFISHLHGDHYFGLIGLLTSYHLMKRTETLTIHAPEALKNIIETQLNASNTVLSYDLIFKSTQADEKQLIYENEHLKVYSFPLVHRIPTTGFIFEEKLGSRRINGEKVDQLKLGRSHYKALKLGNAIEIDGKTYSSEELTLPAYQPRSYVFCSDTCFLPQLKDQFSNVDLLYHEATFTKEATVRAAETYHSTTEQAGQVAKLTNTKELLIGHFSSKYIDLKEVLDEAKAVFPNTQLAIEGEIFDIPRTN